MARWGELVKQMFLKQTAKVAANARRKDFRVSTHLLKADQHAYIPDFVTLGPNHFRKPETGDEHDDLTMTSSNEVKKVKSATTLWHKLKNIQRKSLILDDMVNDMEVMRPQIESCYDWSNADNEYRDYRSLLMVADSIFILQYLFGRDRRANYSIKIKCDILKVENQIPFCVLKQVFEKLKEALLHPDLYREICNQDARGVSRLLLQTAYTELSPLDVAPGDIQIDDAVEKEEPHLLGSIHAIVSQFLTIQQNVEADKRKPTSRQIICNYLAEHVVEKMCRIFFRSYKPGRFPITGYTANELAKAGIKFKSYCRPSENIWFDKYSQTLYLPGMTVTSPKQTEVFFKNLLAFEFNDAARREHVRHFIQLMDALIDTSDDVRRLRKSGVISLGSALSDKDLAKIWDSMHQPFSNGHLEPPEDLKQALDDVLTKKYCIIKCRKMFWKHFTTIISSIWRSHGMF